MRLQQKMYPNLHGESMTREIELAELSGPGSGGGGHNGNTKHVPGRYPQHWIKPHGLLGLYSIGANATVEKLLRLFVGPADEVMGWKSEEALFHNQIEALRSGVRINQELSQALDLPTAVKWK
jgi:hypothetical protein